MAHLLVVDDEESICWGLAKLCQELGHTASVAASAEEGFAQAAAETPDAIILDVRLPGLDGLAAMERFAAIAPGTPMIVITAFGNLDTAVTAVRNGAFDYLTKPFDLDQAATVIRRATCHVSLPAVQADQAPLPSLPDELLGRSPAMQQVFKRIALAAPSDVPVLITGESGTGKELVARAIHRHSLKSSAPLVSVNLAALSPTLVESELFGHVRGAFTGADAPRRGLLELADGATVFFDEIGDIALAVQVKLLRVLEQHEVTPVGDTAPRKTNFRVIAATNRNLNQATDQAAFRQDLFFRLAGFEIPLPPLRQRIDDIPLLAEHLQLARAAGATATGFAPSAVEELCRRPWPGNVRELRHAVEHAALLARGGAIAAEHFPPARPLAHAASQAPIAVMQAAVRQWTLAQLSGGDPPRDLYDRFLAAVEKPLFDVVLEKTAHNRTATADLLGIHRATLRKKLDAGG